MSRYTGKPLKVTAFKGAVAYEKDDDDDVLTGKMKIVLDIISINVYFGYGFEFSVIKIYLYAIIGVSFRHILSDEVDFSFFLSQCVGKKACVSYSTMGVIMLSLYL